jgi:hypothetical protein
MQISFPYYVPRHEELVYIGKHNPQGHRSVRSVQDNVTLQHVVVFTDKIPSNNTSPVVCNQNEFFKEREIFDKKIV